MFSRELTERLDGAVQLARKERHEFVSLEHVLFALTYDLEVTETIEACGGKIKTLRKDLLEFLQKHCPKIGGESSSQVPDAGWKPEPTVAFHRLIQRAAVQVYSADRDVVSTTSVLIALFRERESHAAYFLEKQGIGQFDVINFISHGLAKDSGAQPTEAPTDNPTGDGAAAPQDKPRRSPLESFCVNLNDRAEKGLIDPLVGRDDIIQRTIQILARRTKNNPLLVGEPGVGKTAIADGLALKIVNGEVPSKLSKTKIFSLDMGSLLAGTKFRGEFEERLKGVVKAIQKEEGALLFIDEMHTLVGAGATSGGSMDASNLLKPNLANRTLTVIGSTTHKEFHAHLEKDQALIRRFQKIDIHEPSIDDTIKILEGLKPRYEDFHNVSYPSNVLKTAVTLASKHIHGRPLPDKAIDVMDEVGARIRLKAKEEKRKTITVKDIEGVVSAIAKVPVQSVNANDRKNLMHLEDDLKASIFGQDTAIEKLVSSIKLARTGLQDPQKPIGCYLFTGPTGVGKTEVCRQLAKLLGNELVRFDMSEYMEKHTVARLVGAPPGYVGYDEGGLLTESISKSPYSVLLLDEMEKAHPDISSVLLQVMDNGKLTDTTGKTVDFRHVILVMTSNAGARELAKPSIGIRSEAPGRKSNEAIKKAFSPEFLNRLDAIVTFDPLSEPIVLKVVEKFLEELAAQLKDKKVTLKVTDKAKKWILNEGYDPAYGARPLKRTIDEHVKKPLVDEILFGKLSKGGTISIGEKEGALKFQF